MNENDLAQALNEMAPARNDQALERVVGIAREEVGNFKGRFSSGRRRLMVAAALVACVALVVSLTPPGKAATSWVSDWITGSNDFEPGQYGYQLHTSTLIGYGELPTGDRYQLRGYVGNGKNDIGCVVLLWEHSNDSLPNCAGGWKEGQVSSPAIGRLPEDENDPGASGTFVTGVAPAQSTEVAIRVPASDGVPASEGIAQLFPLSVSITDTTGAEAPIPSVKFFVGYLPPGAGNMRSAPPAEAVAFNGDEEVSSVELTWIRFRPDSEALPLVMSCVGGDTTCQNLLSTTKP